MDKFENFTIWHNKVSGMSETSLCYKGALKNCTIEKYTRQIFKVEKSQAHSHCEKMRQKLKKVWFPGTHSVGIFGALFSFEKSYRATRNLWPRLSSLWTGIFHSARWERGASKYVHVPLSSLVIVPAAGKIQKGRPLLTLRLKCGGKTSGVRGENFLLSMAALLCFYDDVIFIIIFKELRLYQSVRIGSHYFTSNFLLTLFNFFFYIQPNVN